MKKSAKTREKEQESSMKAAGKAGSFSASKDCKKAGSFSASILCRFFCVLQGFMMDGYKIYVQT